MKKTVALSALAVAALAGSAFGQATSTIEFRFVTIAGTGSLPNTTGLADGTVLTSNTAITPSATIRQRIALQARVIDVAGTFTTQQFNGSQTALVPGTVSPASNLGLFSFGGSINMGDSTIRTPGQVISGAWGTGLAGVVAGSSWSNIQRSIGTGTYAAQTWPEGGTAPLPPNPSAASLGSNAWVQIASFFWESNNSAPRTVSGAFAPIAAANTAFIGNGVASATFPEFSDGNVVYSQVFAVGSTQNVQNFSFQIGSTNTDPNLVSTPANITADPFVNPDALNLVLASFNDVDGDNVTVSNLNDGGIGALGGSVSVSGNGGLNPTIVLNWDAPNAAIGNTYVVSFNYTDGIGNVLQGTTSVTVVPAPGALALLGLGGLVAARRRRA